MSLSHPSCVLCGWVIFAQPNEETWVNKFRALIRHSPEAVVSWTGVGIHNDHQPRFKFAPIDPEARNDSPNVNLLELGNLPGQARLEARRDVFLHESCLGLLERYFPGISLNQAALERLYETCTSLPYPESGYSLSWGHDYGGIVDIDRLGSYSWEGCARYDEVDLALSHPTCSANPLCNLEADRILTEPPTVPALTGAFTGASTSGDIFSVLPWEICFRIASYLPTSDFLAARLASKNFCNIFYSQSFWKTRFFGVGERSWLFEATTWPQPASVDWRHIYRRSHDHRLGTNLKNRKRIWLFLDLVAGCVNLRLTKPVEDNLCYSPEMLLSATAMIDKYDKHDTFAPRMMEGCRLFHLHQILVPKSLNNACIHLVRLGDADYITGLTLKGEDGSSSQAGYLSQRQQSISISGQLQGMIVAIHSRGVRAIKFLTTLTIASSAIWLGNPIDCPKTERLALLPGVTGFDVGLDGCKIVSLAVTHVSSIVLQAPYDLRSLAFWYPDVPPPSASLQDLVLPNRRFFVGSGLYTPLIWAHFGGKEGVSLCNLTSITVSLCVGVKQMVFTFDSMPPSTLGRYKRADLESPQSICFTIDGPGGEFIDGVDLYHYVFESTDENGQDEPEFMGLKACKFYTNRGRSCIFKHDSTNLDKYKVHRFANRSETTRITGFYTQQQPEICSGFFGFGAVLETFRS